MTRTQQRIYRRVMRRFAAGKLRDQQGRVVRDEAAARQLAEQQAREALDPPVPCPPSPVPTE